MTEAPALPAAQRYLIAYGNWIFRYRDSAFPVFFVGALLLFPPAVAADPACERVLDLLGLLLAFAGQMVRNLSIGSAAIKRAGASKRIAADTLVTDGIYAHVRNPLYVGNLLILSGLLILLNHPVLYLVGTAFFLGSYVAIVVSEEQFLLGRFGDTYREYCAHTNRLLPRAAGLWETLRALNFNWRRMLLKEYASAAMWLSTALIILAYGSFRAPLGHTVWPVSTLGGILLGLALCTLFIRFLKKRHLLRE